MANLKHVNKASPASNDSIFDIAIEMLLLALVFLAPVVFDRSVGIVFSLTKVTVIRVIALLILSVWSIKILLKQEHRFIRTPLDYPVLSYLLCLTVAGLTSVHVLISFMGFYGRYEGFSTLWIYCLIFFVVTNFIKTKEQIMRIIYTVLFAGVCMSLYGVIQRFHLDPYAWGGVVTWQRVIGMIGQPNFLAAYVDMAFILGLAVLLNIKDVDIKDIWNYRRNIMARAGLVLSLGLIYVCILYTVSRGGFLGLFAGMSLFFLLSKRDLVIRKRYELIALFIIIFAVTLVTSLNPETSPFGRVTSEENVVEEVHAKETPIITYSAALSRLETWKSGLRIAADYPFFGIGEETLKMVFPRYETNRFRFYEGFHVKQDRCHNEVCDMSVTRGSITLYVYLWMLATFFYLGVKIIKNDYDPELKILTSGFLGASVAYLAQNQFSFGVVAITTLLWMMMGMTASIYVKPEPSPKPKQMDLSSVPWLIIAIVIALAAYLCVVSVVQFRADIYFKNARSLADYRSFDQAEGQFKESIRILPYEGQTWTHYGITLLNLAQLKSDKSYLTRAVDVFNVGTKLDAYNADNFYIGGRAFLMYTAFDPTAWDKVVDYEKKALQIDPLYAEAYQIIGAVYEKQGKLKEAGEMYEKTLEVNPQVTEAITGLSNISAKQGDANKVIDIFKKFLDLYPNNAVFQENLAILYIRRNNLVEARKIYEAMIEVNPQNYRALVNLGFLVGQMGDINKAKGLFESAIMVDPKAVDAHNGLGMVYMKLSNAEKAREEFSQSLMVDPNNQYAIQMMGKLK